MHPNNLYNTIKFAGFISSPITNQVPWQDNAKITPLLRLLFSMFQFVVLSVIAFYLVLRKSPTSLLMAAIFLAVAISPIAIDTSANLQVDGSVGVLMSGLFAIAILYFLSSTTRNTFSYIMLFAATFFLATGKQEWSMVLVIALIITAVYTCYAQKKFQSSQSLDKPVVIAILSGLAAGHLFSYLICPQNYMGAFTVLWQFSRVENLLSGQIETERWISLTLSRLRWICTIAALAVISGIFIFRRLKVLKPLELLIWLYGIGLFCAFVISNWNHESRYFAPALITLTIATIAVFPPDISKNTLAVTSVLLILMLAVSGIFLYNNIVRKPLKPYFDSSEIALKPGQIAILSTAQAWNRPEIDFANYNSRQEGVERFAEKHNKTLYPEDFVWPDYSKSK